MRRNNNLLRRWRSAARRVTDDADELCHKRYTLSVPLRTLNPYCPPSTRYSSTPHRPKQQ
jgi:hypothetical protein